MGNDAAFGSGLAASISELAARGWGPRVYKVSNPFRHDPSSLSFARCKRCLNERNRVCEGNSSILTRREPYSQLRPLNSPLFETRPLCSLAGKGELGSSRGSKLIVTTFAIALSESRLSESIAPKPFMEVLKKPF